jgi:hypothetical protein
MIRSEGAAKHKLLTDCEHRDQKQIHRRKDDGCTRECNEQRLEGHASLQ